MAVKLLRRCLRRCFPRIVIFEFLLGLRRRPGLHSERVDRFHLLLQHSVDRPLSLQQHHAVELGADGDGRTAAWTSQSLRVLFADVADNFA